MDIKIKNHKTKTSSVSPEGYTFLYIVFQYGLKPVLIQRIFIGENLLKDQLYLFRGQSGHSLVLLFDELGESGQRIIIQWNAK